MECRETAQSTAQLGNVKWFDTKKDYGFIVPASGGEDILLHGNVLRSFGQSSILKGTEVAFTVHETEQGPQTSELLSQTLPDHIETDYDPKIESIPLVPARVKWYDSKRGFGFAQAFGDGQDILIHRVVLNKSGLDDVAAGEAICLRCDDTERGKVALQVLTWMQQ